MTIQMGKSIVQAIKDAENFKTLETALRTAGLVRTLSGKGPFTVFAPSDAAFQKLPSKTLAPLLSNKEELAKVLKYHVLPAGVTLDALRTMKSAPTLGGAEVEIHKHRIGQGVNVNDAEIVRADLECTNGIIHTIDKVLLPK